MFRGFLGKRICLIVLLAIFIAGAFSLFSSNVANATNPTTINFQGKVVNANGTNVTNGTYTFLFKLYTVSSGGSAIWTETDSLTVTNGVFQVPLGAVCPLFSSNACNSGAINFGTSSSLYLGITFNSDPAGEMTPRVQLQSVPYAFNADNLGGLSSSSFGQLAASQTWTGTNEINTLSTTAFQIQNGSGAGNLLVANTTNTVLGVGLVPSSTGALLQVGGSESLTGTLTGPTINATTSLEANGTAGVTSTCGAGQARENDAVTEGLLTTAGTCTSVQAAGNYLIQAPTTTATNTITSATASIVGLTVNGTSSTSAVAAIFNQTNNTAPADTVQINDTSTGTQTNDLLLTRSGTGTTTNLLNLTNTSGTATNGLTLTATTAIGNGIDFTGAGGYTDLINSTNFLVTNAGAVTAVGVTAGTGLLQGAGGFTVTGTTNINNTSAGTTNIGGASAGTIALQSSSTIGITIGASSTFGATANSTVSGTGYGYTLQAGNESGTTSTGGSITIDAGTGTTTNGTISIGTLNAKGITIGNTTAGTTTTIQSPGGTILGKAGPSGVNGTLQFDNSVGANTVGLSLQANPASGFTLLLPTTAPLVSQCLQSSSGTALQLTFASCAAGSTLQAAYNTSAGASPSIQTSSSFGAVSIEGVNSNATEGGNLITNTSNFTAGWSQSSGTNWTLGASSAAHTAGSVAYLYNTAFTPTASTYYELIYTFSGASGNGTDAITPTIGGVNGETIYAASGTFDQVIYTTGTGSLEFTPTTSWAGSITSVIVYKVTQIAASVFQTSDQSGNAFLQVKGSGSEYNDFLGLDSGEFDTTGFQNTALGVYSLQYNTTGSNNIALGYASLVDNTSGLGNIAIGPESSYYNTTGYSNTAVGFQTLFNNTTGNNNTAYGYSSLLDNTFGNSNTAIGLNSLENNTIGNDNVALGLDALQPNTIGVNNTALGYGALDGNISGADNVALGFASLGSNSIGNNDTAVGYGANTTATNLGDATVIGSYAEVSQSNSLVLGCVSGVNGCGTTTEVGIDEATPADALQIYSTNSNDGLTITNNAASNPSAIITFQAANNAYAAVNIGQIASAGQYFANSSDGDFIIRSPNSNSVLIGDSSVAADDAPVKINNTGLTVDGGNVGGTGDIYLQNGTDYSNSLRPSQITLSGNLAGQIVNPNNQFLDGITGYSLYDNSGGGHVSISAATAPVGAPSTSGTVLEISYNGTGTYNSNPAPGYGGTDINDVPFCGASSNAVSSFCYQEGARYENKVWADIPVGYNLNFNTNGIGTGSTVTWITPVAGTGTWQQYDAIETIGVGGSPSANPAYLYLTGAAGAGAFNWYVANWSMEDLDSTPSIQSADSLNIGYITNLQQNFGDLGVAGNEVLNGGKLTLGNATSNDIFYGTVGLAVPGAGSVGEKIQLYGTAGTVGSTDYAIGIQSAAMWFNVGASGSYDFYSSSSLIASIDTTGDITGDDAYIGNDSACGAGSAQFSLSTYANSCTNYGFLQQAAATFVNAPSGDIIYFRDNNSTEGYFDGAGNLDVIGNVLALNNQGTGCGAGQAAGLLDCYVSSAGNDAFEVYEAGSSPGPSDDDLAVNSSGAVIVNFQNSYSHAVCKSGAADQPGVFVIGACNSGFTDDYAELYPTDNTVSAGDIVMPSGNYISSDVGAPQLVPVLTNTTSAYDSNAIGVISSQTLASNGGDPTLQGLNFSQSDNPQGLALNGRVMTNVDTENGPIEPGDYITSSSTPGVGMKATQAGEVVGQALQSYDGNGVSQILVFVNPFYYPGPSMSSYIQNGGNATFNDLVVGGTASFSELNTSGTATVNDLEATTANINENLSVAGMATINNLTVTGSTVFDGSISIAGHIITAGGVPLVMTGSSSGLGSSVTITGDDTTGTIVITTGSNPTPGDLADVTFSNIYTAVPHILISGQDGDSAASFMYPSDKSTSGFNLSMDNTPKANTTYTFDYFIAQ